MAAFSGGIIGFAIWAAVGVVCVFLLWALSRARGFLRAAFAMWRPVVVVVAAAILLFVSGQGRELGVSLLGERNGLPIICLFLALIYWATNNWHTATLGLNRALKGGALCEPPAASCPEDLPPPDRHFLNGRETWIYWPPRVLGVCAHLFAAINLSLAAWALPLSAWGGSPIFRCLAWTAPLAIALVTVLVWAADRHWSTRGKKIASQAKTRWISRVGWGSGIGEVLLLSGLAFIALYLRQVPGGFVLGTISISLSAAAFLGLISWLRDRNSLLNKQPSHAEREQNDSQEKRQADAFTIGLFLLACAITLAVWISPIQVGQVLGSMVVAYFAFGAILALLNAVEFTLGWIAERQWFGEQTKPFAIGAYFGTFVILFGIANAFLHPFHHVRVCDTDCVAPQDPGFSVAINPDDRPTVRKAAETWYAQAKAAYATVHGDAPVPMLIVATAGGGIRAAYWTATILERLEKDFQAEGGVRPYLFAVSGVSGGSVGATAFEAALVQRDERKGQCTAGDATCPYATRFLTEDFLAPTLASWIFVDAPSSFLPDLGQNDRGTTLEKSFEDATGGLLTRPFLSFFRSGKAAQGTADQMPWWRPILLLNATHEETGKRIITGHVLIERDVFLDSLDMLHVLRSDVRASTAAHNSARFTYVSPAGDLGNGSGSVIDGGYFENYGALSALELARAARYALQDQKQSNGKPAVKPVILIISSDPSLGDSPALVRINDAEGHGKCLVSIAEREGGSPAATAKAEAAAKPNYLSLDAKEFENAWLNEFFAPLQGIKNVREAHGTRAAAELAVEICTETAAAQDSVEPRSPQVQTAGTLDKAKDANLKNSTPVEAGKNDPYLAHLAMCTNSKAGEAAPIQAPLGWVLSKATQDAFADLLTDCGNGDQLRQLEIALGKPARQQTADQQMPQNGGVQVK